MPLQPHPRFFIELERRIRQGKELAQQYRYADARVAHYRVLELAAESRVIVPIRQILDVWRDMVYCDLGMDDFESAEKIVRAADAFLFEWDEHRRAGRNRQHHPSVYKSDDLVRPLIPGTLEFVVPDTFDLRPYLSQYHTFQKMIDPHLGTVDQVVETLSYFAEFYCGAPQKLIGDFNWFVVKDRLAFFSPNKESQQYDAGILRLSDMPGEVFVGAALTPDGCRIVLHKKMILLDFNHKGDKTVLEETIPANRRELWKFLNGWVRQKVLIPTGWHFKIGV